ncbi:MAG: hypothetical protein WAR78_16615 [Ferruginibacter sp.]
MHRIIYFIIVFVTLVGCNSEIIKDKSINIVIDGAQSYKYDLTKGIYTVHFMDRPDTIIKFLLSSDEINKIVDKYYDLEINDITGVDKELGTILIEDNCMIMPKPFTILHVKSKTKSQDIQIDEGCDKFSLGNVKRGKSVTLFLDFIRAILKSKPEINNAPKSNVMYM